MSSGGMSPGAASPVGRLFDELAVVYDQSGVAFFEPIAERLVTMVAPQPGDAVVDLGCGRGAVTLRLARQVGPEGHVRAIDLASGMVAATESDVHREGLSWVEVVVGDAADPEVPAGSAAVVTASLVLFFLPSPGPAVRRWLDLLEPDGRLGITTFGTQDDVWRSVDELFDPYLPACMLDARTSGRRGPFSSESALAALVDSVGGVVSESVEEPLRVRFADVVQWERFSRSTGQRQMWDLVPPGELDRLRESAERLLESARPGSGGPIELTQVVRYTIATDLRSGADSPGRTTA